jgi:hypothetical protein
MSLSQRILLLNPAQVTSLKPAAGVHHKRISAGLRKFVSKSKNKCTKDRFPEKLWRIVNECNTGAIGWSPLEPDVICIKYKEFTQQYLTCATPAFKTTNIASFVRQLNLYGFYKVHCTSAKRPSRHVLIDEAEAPHYFMNRIFRKDQQPIGMSRKYGISDLVRDGTHFHRSISSCNRRSSSSAAAANKMQNRILKQMDAAASSSSASTMTFEPRNSQNFVPDLMSSLHERDIETHCVRFHSPVSPVIRKVRKGKQQLQVDEQNEENGSGCSGSIFTGGRRQSRKLSTKRLKRQENQLPITETSLLIPESIPASQSPADSEVQVIGGCSGSGNGHVIPASESPADSSEKWFTEMLTQLDQFHLNQSFDHMVSLLGGEADVNWYPRSWNRIVTMREVMDQNITPLAVIPASLMSGYQLIPPDSFLF